MLKRLSTLGAPIAYPIKGISSSLIRRIRYAPCRTITTTTSTAKPIPSHSSLSKQFFLSSFKPKPKPKIRSGSSPFASQRFFSASQTCQNQGFATGSAIQQSMSIKDRMKRLGREYGWSAFGVYMALSALDFPLCYMLVRTLGTDRIGRWEETVMFHVKKLVPDAVEEWWRDWRAKVKSAEKEFTGKENVNNAAEMATWGVEEADAEVKKDASLGTQLALAYAIHKSFIFVRVPLTAAVTPKVVKILRSWGWDIGKKTTKAAKAAKRAELQKP